MGVLEINLGVLTTHSTFVNGEKDNEKSICQHRRVGSIWSSDNPSELADLKIICSKNIPTIRYIPLKFRIPWSGIITSIIDGCISNLDSVDNWKKFFAVKRGVKTKTAETVSDI